ncbi:carboxypeptidase-like regulatory domain-containing protein [Granulicella arctica]|uniref:carboxypeptidase-like regulatory domain-containing protein n=1 Tax=Granulicella arctica TaxID=940613 RepID=UPI0021DF5339|nr:carboxypeptidase-like regulatory domain-containing protein [Granulicella arctica]
MFAGNQGRSFGRRIYTAMLIALTVVWVGTAHAQLSTASVNGVVHDASGASVVNATVKLRNLDTSVETVTASNNTGSYTIVSVTPGQYTLEATAPSFGTQKITTFTLTVGQTATIEFTLVPGEQSSVINVQGSAPLLETTTANLGTVISTRQVNDLPLNGRNFTQLLQLTPGVAPTNTGQSNGGGFAGPPVAFGSSTSFPAVNGQSNRSNFFLTDGLNNYGSILSTYDVPPIIDAIQEFKIVSHTDSAEYGGVMGGVVNVVTKSGGNDFHGSGWEFARNDIFDARTYFLPTTSAKAVFQQNQFGGSIGGPVLIPKLYQGRDKTFFFGAYQGFRYNQTQNASLTVPTAAELNGDLSALGKDIYNPFTTRPDPAKPGQYIRDIFPGRQIPKSLIDPRMVAFAQFVYPAAGTALANGTNAVDTTPLTQTQNEFTVRVDHTFGAKDSAWFRYSFINSLQTQSGGVPGLVSTLATPARNYGGSYVHIFNPGLIVQAQYARTTGQHNNTALYTKSTAAILSQVGFDPSLVSGFVANGGGSLVPSLGITGFSGGGETIQNTPKATDSNEFRATVTKIIGRHELHMGGGYTSIGFSSPIASSSVQFQSTQTANPEDASTGNALASFLLNTPDGAQRRNVNETERPGGVLSAFAQDSWRLSDKLTLNYGLRYDVTFIPGYGSEDSVGQQGGIETGDVDLMNGVYILQKAPPACSVRGHAPCIPGDGSLPAHVIVDPRGKIPHNVYLNFGPRAGFAYRYDDKTVIRGAFGIVYDQWAAATQMGQNIEGSWPDTGQIITGELNLPTSTGQTPTTTTQNPLAATGSGNFPAPTPFQQVGFFYDPHIKNPYSEQYNVGIARQLGSATTVTVNYVGSSGHRLDVGGYYNTAPTPGPGDPQARAPFPYIHPTYYDRSTGSSSYNAMQLSVEKRYTNSFSYSVSYTWSKSIDEGGDGWFGVEGGVPQDPYHPAAFGSRSVAGNDLRNVLSVSTLYSIPVGRGAKFSTGNGIADYILGNWQLNNIFLARSGQPFTPNISGDIANTGNGNSGYETANVVGDPNNIKNRSAVEYFNTAAYAAPANFTFGTAGRNSLRSAGYWNLDTSVFRKFPIRDRYTVELRGEAFNIFNHPVLGTPDSNFSDTTFGQVSNTASTTRQLQLGAKFIF